MLCVRAIGSSPTTIYEKHGRTELGSAPDWKRTHTHDEFRQRP